MPVMLPHGIALGTKSITTRLWIDSGSRVEKCMQNTMIYVTSIENNNQSLCILLSVTSTFLKCIITLSILRSTFNYVIVRPKTKIYLENFFVS